MRLIHLLPILLFIALAIGFGFGLKRDPHNVPNPNVGRILPTFTLEAVDHTTPALSSTDFHNKPILLNVFASWCATCRAEHPLLMKLKKRYNLPVYGLDWKDKKPDAQRWLAQHGNPYERIGFDGDGRTGIDLGVTGTPESFLIAPDGRILFHHAGPLTVEIVEQTIRPIMQQYGG